ncbi:MAG TPA: serine hydrolase domain-containing protein [Nocardioides sp.]|nr:serine hydrolase domain-containing protein [Nocardioides sp.]
MSRQLRLEALQAGGRLPGVVAGVLADGELVWTGAAGMGDVDQQYRIGSITKTMTAVAVLQLRDEGRLDLDHPIGRYVPETGYADATLRTLLSHTSGMQSEPVGSWWERSPGSDFVTLVAGNDGSGAVAGAGEYYHYSNLGFALLGEAVARLRGATWWDVTRERLLGPLGMSRTSYHPEAPSAQGFSVDHFAGTLMPEPHQDTGAMAPAGQAWSTVADLARWARFLADGHPDVLAAATLREMSRPQAPAEMYGLGLKLVDQGGRRLVGHGGTMPGFMAGIFVDPERCDGVVVLCNATTGLSYETTPEKFLGQPGEAMAVPAWVPTEQVPDVIVPVLGLWFWGNTAVELRWQNERLEIRGLNSTEVSDAFELRDGRLVGVSGYHRGETLHVRPTHLECATFVYTRTPYDPEAPIPGGPQP